MSWKLPNVCFLLQPPETLYLKIWIVIVITNTAIIYKKNGLKVFVDQLKPNWPSPTDTKKVKIGTFYSKYVVTWYQTHLTCHLYLFLLNSKIWEPTLDVCNYLICRKVYNYFWDGQSCKE